MWALCPFQMDMAQSGKTQLTYYLCGFSNAVYVKYIWETEGAFSDPM